MSTEAGAGLRRRQGGARLAERRACGPWRHFPLAATIELPQCVINCLAERKQVDRHAEIAPSNSNVWQESHGRPRVLNYTWKSVAAGSLLVFSVSALAVPPPSATVPPGVAKAVDDIYRLKRYSLWFENGQPTASAVKLLSLVRHASIDGMTNSSEIARKIEQAVAAARAGDLHNVSEAEQMLSSAFVVYVQALRTPSPGMIYDDPGNPPTAPQASVILGEAAGATSLEAHLASVSEVNPIYKALRDAALESSQSEDRSALPTLRANLERARAIPAKGRFILVDIAAARLWMHEDGLAIGSMKVIVGKPEHATPMIASIIHYVTFNPFWHVPDHLVRKLAATRLIVQGSTYLKSRGYEVVSDYERDAKVLSSDTVDWKAVATGQDKAKIRQLPSAHNSMGKVKFSFRNGEGIFLHDTPDKALFNSKQRTLSNGCVRLEDAPKLARWLLGRDIDVLPSRPEQQVRLPEAVPIYITYLTARPNGKTLTYVDDVYRRDPMRTDSVAQ